MNSEDFETSKKFFFHRHTNQIGLIQFFFLEKILKQILENQSVMMLAIQQLQQDVLDLIDASSSSSSFQQDSAFNLRDMAKIIRNVVKQYPQALLFCSVKQTSDLVLPELLKRTKVLFPEARFRNILKNAKKTIPKSSEEIPENQSNQIISNVFPF